MKLCPKPESSDFHRLCCIDRSCEECGTHRLKLLPEEQSEEGTTKWKRFDYVLTGKVTASGEPQKKIALVQTETCPKEPFQYFIQLLEDYPYHQFMAIWQRKQLDELLETLLLDMPSASTTTTTRRATLAEDRMKSSPSILT